jgi:monovalent cation:H+ antiporter, CPA1 family
VQSTTLNVAEIGAASLRAGIMDLPIVGNPSSVSDSAVIFSGLRTGDLLVLLLTLSIVLRIINYHYVKWPSSIMLAFGSIAGTVVVLLASKLSGHYDARAFSEYRNLFMQFPDLVLNYMLGFLLFAAAIEVDLRALRRIATTVFALCFFTTLLSALIMAVLTYLLMLRVSKIDFWWCLLYGAIVSPTDPVAVISILNEKPGLLPSSTRYFVLGESLLNDAIGVLLYLISSEMVENPDINFLQVIGLFAKGLMVEGAFGIAIGVVLAWIAYSTIKSIDEMLLEVAITFVLVGNINLICRLVNASIPLASVAAGLFIGNYGVTYAFSAGAVHTFHEMWKLLDETLNSLLFLLIGAADMFWEPGAIGAPSVVFMVIGTVCISLFARFVSVAAPLMFIIFAEWIFGVRLRHPSVRYRGGTIAVLTWGGMRGGISIALALAVPDAFALHAVPGRVTYGQLLFFMTFSLVVFSICVQGLLFEPVVRLIDGLSRKYFPSGGFSTFQSRLNLNDTGSDACWSDDFDHVENEDMVLATGGMGLGRSESWDDDDPLEREWDEVGILESTFGPDVVHHLPPQRATAYDSPTAEEDEDSDNSLHVCPAVPSPFNSHRSSATFSLLEERQSEYGTASLYPEPERDATVLVKPGRNDRNKVSGTRREPSAGLPLSQLNPVRLRVQLSAEQGRHRGGSRTFENLQPLKEPDTIPDMLRNEGQRFAGMFNAVSAVVPAAAFLLGKSSATSSDTGGPLRRSQTMPATVATGLPSRPVQPGSDSEDPLPEIARHPKDLKKPSSSGEPSVRGR